MKFAGLMMAILSTVLMLSADTTNLSYGFKTGLNLAMHYGTKTDDGEFEVSPGLRAGFVGGAWLEMELLPYLGLNYELLYSMKGSREKIRVLKLDGEELSRPAEMNVRYNMDYLELPIYLKIRTWENNNLSLSALSGTAMGLRVNGSYALEGTVFMPNGNNYDEIHLQSSEKLSGVNIFDYALVYGTELRYSGRIEAALELRFTLGWDYLSLPTSEFTEPVELRNQTYSAMLNIRF